MCWHGFVAPSPYLQQPSWSISRVCCFIQKTCSAHGEQPSFDSVFGNFVSNLDNMPIEHHMLIAMQVPRGLPTVDNNIDWLRPESTRATGVAAKEVLSALGIPSNTGVSQPASEHTQSAIIHPISIEKTVGTLTVFS